jgi:hypothetical protein
MQSRIMSGWGSRKHAAAQASQAAAQSLQALMQASYRSDVMIVPRVRVRPDVCKHDADTPA